MQADDTVDRKVNLVSQHPTTVPTCNIWLYLHDVTYLCRVPQWKSILLNASFDVAKDITELVHHYLALLHQVKVFPTRLAMGIAASCGYIIKK